MDSRTGHDLENEQKGESICLLFFFFLYLSLSKVEDSFNA